ncbi:MAG: PrsW family intramembrane metalloprotease [Anaerolineae bacterium]|nr:PrsW family intramembrane metalloprotease [Anaerolineae bacterium]
MIQPARQPDFLSLAQILISGIGILFFLSAGGSMLLLGFVLALTNGFSSAILPFFNAALAATLLSVLLMPPIYYAVRSLSGYHSEISLPCGKPRRNLLVSLFVLWGLSLLLGEILIRQGGWMLLGIPPLLILVVGLPLFVIVRIGQSETPAANLHRDWGTISFGLVITPAVVVLIEIAVIITILVLATVLLASQPEIMEKLNISAQRLINSEMNPEVVQRVIRPYLQQPGVLFAILAIGAGLVPVIEELLKPLALWPLIHRIKSPQEGFRVGILCGAAFALFESMGIMTTTAMGNWAMLAIARAGTGLLHIVTTGLVGWGLASAWQREQYLRLGSAFLLAVVLHSVWNIFGLLIGLVPFLETDSVALRLGEIAPLALVILISTLFLLLTGCNRRLSVGSCHQIPLKG